MTWMSFKVITLMVLAIYSYINVFITFITLVEFLSKQDLIPKNVKNKGTQESLQTTLINNGILSAMFFAQHSGMASRWWKNLFVGKSYAAIERPFYVISTCLVLQHVMGHWSRFHLEPLWIINTSDDDNSMLWVVFTILHGLLWVTIYGASLTMDLPELIGIKQVYYALSNLGDPLRKKSPKAQALYTNMRHPGAIAFIVILWVHPVMTVERAVLAWFATIYMWFGFRMDSETYSYIEEQASKKHAAVNQQPIPNKFLD